MHSNKSKCINTPLSGDNAAKGLFEGKYEKLDIIHNLVNLNQSIICQIIKKTMK